MINMAITDKNADKYQKENNFIEIVKRDLEGAIKETVIEDIIKQQLIEFEEKIRPLVKAQVAELSFKGMAKVREHMALRDEFVLYLEWNGNEKQKVYTTLERVEVEELDK